MNYIFLLFYNGLFYKGSQSQLNFYTIHDIFLYILYKFNKKIVKSLISSRTDKGVNCLFQIFQIFGKDYYNKKYLINYLNSLNFNIIGVVQVSKKFHCIYSVLSRYYCYIFSLKKELFFNYGFFLNYSLNFYLIIYFFKNFIGFKNFFIFDFYKNFFFYNSSKLIYEINFYKKNLYIYIVIKGNSFLYKMIRNIISYLMYFIYNNYNTYIYNFFYLKYYLFFLPPICPNYLFLIYIKYLLQ